MDTEILINAWLNNPRLDRQEWYRAILKLKEKNNAEFWYYVDEAMREIASDNSISEKYQKAIKPIKEMVLILVAGLKLKEEYGDYLDYINLE